MPHMVLGIFGYFIPNSQMSLDVLALIYVIGYCLKTELQEGWDISVYKVEIFENMKAWSIWSFFTLERWIRIQDTTSI